MKKWRTGVLLAILLLALLASTVAAMTSTNYMLNWYIPLTSGSGSNMSSSNYNLGMSSGQVGGLTGLSSTNYKLGLGYWPGVGILFRTFIPTLRK